MFGECHTPSSRKWYIDSQYLSVDPSSPIFSRVHRKRIVLERVTIRFCSISSCVLRSFFESRQARGKESIEITRRLVSLYMYIRDTRPIIP